MFVRFQDHKNPSALVSVARISCLELMVDSSQGAVEFHGVTSRVSYSVLLAVDSTGSAITGSR
jgi:hypothetical protein